ncbi:MAG: hypothetical protein K2O78_01685 [Muribaculaceae bacterium]|nr:hypothetical protein [Muribaculaceae bacterium]
MKQRITIAIGSLSVFLSFGIVACDRSASHSTKAEDVANEPVVKAPVVNAPGVNDPVVNDPVVKVPVVKDIAADSTDLLTVTEIKTRYGNLLCISPDMSRLKMDMVCGGVPTPDNDSIMLVFAGAFTGKYFDKGHANIAGNHVAGGRYYAGYRCMRNTGAFTWSAASGPRFFYKDYASALNKAAREGGMGFAQEMMIHDGKAVKTTRKLGDKNVFRALCLDSRGELAVYESQEKVTFGKFIDALLSQGVKEALYTDMGYGWNYCFYRPGKVGDTPIYLHAKSYPYASNFITISLR